MDQQSKKIKPAGTPPVDPIVWPMLIFYGAAAAYGGFQIGLRSSALFDMIFLSATLGLGLFAFWWGRKRERSYLKNQSR